MNESIAIDARPATVPFDWAGLVSELQSAAGSDAAARRLALRLTPGLEALLRQQGLAADQRADLVQDTLTAVVRAVQARRLENAAALPAFARSTAQHLAIDAKRRTARETGLSEESWERVPAESRGPAEQLEQEQTRTFVKQLLAELPVQRDREVLERYYVMDEDKITICQRLALSPEHFDRVVYRARQRFRSLWEERHGHR